MTQPTRPSSPADSTQIFRMSTENTVPNIMEGTRQSHPTLAIVKGPQAGAVFELTEQEVTLGRDPSNSVFLNDMTVSRHHARMNLANIAAGDCSIEDLGSLNGTWVDGAIVNSAALHDGSTIQIGTFRMVFHTNTM